MFINLTYPIVGSEANTKRMNVEKAQTNLRDQGSLWMANVDWYQVPRAANEGTQQILK